MLASWVAIASLLTAGPSSAEVRRLVRDSIREYNAGDFELSLRDAKRAYEISGLPALLYDLGQSHRALGHWKEAEFYYRGYLREQREAPNRQEVMNLVQEMAAKVAATERASPRPAAAPTLSPAPVIVEAAPPAAVSEGPTPGRVPAATWWLGGSTLAVGAAGTILGIVASSTLSADHPSPLNGFTVHSIPASQFQAGYNESLAADVLWGVGGALLVATIVVALAR